MRENGELAVIFCLVCFIIGIGFGFILAQGDISKDCRLLHATTIGKTAYVCFEKLEK